MRDLPAVAVNLPRVSSHLDGYRRAWLKVHFGYRFGLVLAGITAAPRRR